MSRHRLDPVALVFGLLAIVCAGAWLAWDQDVVTAGELALAAPITLIVLGAVGVVTSVLRNSPHPSPVQPAEQQTTQERTNEEETSWTQDTP